MHCKEKEEELLSADPAASAIIIAFLHEIGSRIQAADKLSMILDKIVDFAVSVVHCDSCFVYLLEDSELVLAASKNPHPELVNRLRLLLGEGITGWVAEHREPVIVTRKAFEDRRFRVFHELPEDRYEAFLSVPIISRMNRVMGVINLQDRDPHSYSQRDIQLISTIGFLVGAAIEMAHLEKKNSELADALMTRKLIERAKGILQREFHLSEEDAYLALQKQSRQRRKSMKEIAEAIILNEEMRREQSSAGNGPSSRSKTP